MFNANIYAFLASVAIILPAFLIALSFHEFSHAFVAYLLGDSTAKDQGRMTINPLAHIDLMGTIFLLIFRVGWAKPVPMTAANFKHPRFYSVLTAFAGPFSNFILAFVFFTFIKYLPFVGLSIAAFKTLNSLFEACAYVNVMLGVFNMLPIPPLDGSHLIHAFLYKRFPNFVIFLYRYSIFFLLFLLFLPATRTWLIKLIYLASEFIKSLVF